jgi:hypothetical protein
VNFLNKKNAADVRVYQLLDQKFKLFDGVFGASDDVIGAIGNGVDFEKRIAQIYNDCRTTDEIQQAFDELQEELKFSIAEKIQNVRSTLLEKFDEEVKEKLKVDFANAQRYLNVFEQKLWKITQYFLDKNAHFDDENYSFSLTKNPFPDEHIHSGPYMILKSVEGRRKSEIEVPEDTNIYRIGHKLAQRILMACSQLDTPLCELVFDYHKSGTKISLLENRLGQSGWLQVKKLTVKSFDEEDFLLIAFVTDEGEVIDKEIAERLFSLNAWVGQEALLTDQAEQWLTGELFRQQEDILNENTARNRDYFDAEMDKLDQWADDMKISLEKEIKDLDAEIKLRKSEAKKMMNLEAKVKAQRIIKEMEKKRSEKRQTLFAAQDDIDGRKDDLLTDIESRLNQHIEQKELFTVNWKIV